MRINFLGVNSKTDMTGGRISAWTLAESLAADGHSVNYVTNCRPLLLEDFEPWSRVNLVEDLFLFNTENIKFRTWLLHPNALRGKVTAWAMHRRRLTSSDLRADWTIIIPHQGHELGHRKMLNFAQRTSRKVALFNFETPNFFNEYSPVKRSEAAWRGWVHIARYADLIISNSYISHTYARSYFSCVRASCGFSYWLTAINNWAADHVSHQGLRRKDIVCLTRPEAKKGLDHLTKILGEHLRGFRLIVCVGSSEIPKQTQQKLGADCAATGVELVILNRVMAEKKYSLLKGAGLLVFPSLFESFGLPVLEALYCKTPTVAFDLPPYHEFTFGEAHLAAHSNWDQLRNLVERVIRDRPSLNTNNWHKIAEVARIEDCGRRGTAILNEHT